MMNSQYYFTLEQLSVGYNGRPIIQDINIEVKKGEIVTLIGPNGAGKSTILKSISRQLKTIKGRVLLDGKDIRKLSYREMSSKMAVVLTEKMKPELMTCHDVIATGRYPYTGRLGRLTIEDERKVDEAIRAVHAETLGAKDFNAISDGQKQRVLLARAICQEPEIMLLDEPTSFLDVRYKLELLSILKKMARERGITVIMSLHEIDLAMKISDKICCVKGDRIAKYGAPEDVFDDAAIRDLYEIDNGYFDTTFGSIELPRPMSDEKVFVIAGGGYGIPIYRKLQKNGQAFITGVMYDNDVDYQLAKILAEAVIAQKMFEPISDRKIDEALTAMNNCARVIYAGTPIGAQNAGIARLIEQAGADGKLERISTDI